jgi:DNA-binding transcriptional LysR family regulator
MDSLKAYAAFARIFEAGSISAVAREMGITQSAVSKQIVALEAGLGVQLFARTTRRLQPTHEALALYEHVKQLLDAVESLRTDSGRLASVSGTLRITVPGAFGRLRICPRLPAFLSAFPAVRLDVMISDQVIDLVEERVELGVRIGPLAPSTLMARPIGAMNQVLVASPSFLSGRKRLDSPVDLAAHPCVLQGGPTSSSRWEFDSESGRQAVDVDGAIRVNDLEAALGLVCAHQGMGLLPDWMVAQALAENRLVRLLPDFYPRPMAVNIVYPQTRFLSRRARGFIDFLVAERAAQRI